MRDVALEVPLGFFALSGRGKGHHAADAGVEGFGDALDGAALAGRVAAFKQDHDAQAAVTNPFLELDQLDLEAAEFAVVVAVLAEMEGAGGWRRRFSGILAIRGSSLPLRTLVFSLALVCHIRSSDLAGPPARPRVV